MIPSAAVPIVPGLYLIPGENRGRFPFSHSVLAVGSATALIDAGCGEAALAAVREQARPDVVIASHSHIDHASGCWLVPGSRLLAPEQAAGTFGRLELLADRFAEPGSLAAKWLAFACKATGMRDAPPSGLYGDGEVFDLGGIRLTSVHAPGHTVDHMCFWEPVNGVALTSDIDLTGFGPWYGHRESSIAQFKASICRVMDLQPRVVVSSHLGVVRDDIQGRLQRFLDAFDKRDWLILDLLREPRSLPELVEFAPIYGRFPYAERILRHWEAVMIGHHLAGLAAEGRVEERDGRWARTRHVPG